MGHFVWDWISCSFVDPVEFPSILDLHDDLDHNVTYASIVETVPLSPAIASPPPITITVDSIASDTPVTPAVSAVSAPASPPTRIV